MSYSAEVYNVMIASPSDVSAERGIVREVIHEWNSVHASRQKIVLMPVGWETHSAPAMGAPAQTILNQQILNRCDLLIGIFWTRVGTATERYDSGSVEEIELHLAAGKPAMLYFSSAPVRPDSVDAAQYERLKTFRTSCQGRGLYHAFDNLSRFRDDFYRHLQLTINEHASPSDRPSDAFIASESSVAVPQLSKEAERMIREAASDPHGVVMHMRFIGGTSVQANGKNMIADNNRREIAAWEAALDELVLQGMLIDRNKKGEYFELTKQGYETAENLRD